MNRIFPLALFAAMVVLMGACGKEEVNPDSNSQDTTPVVPTPAPNEQFLGDYDLSISYITYMDGILQDETNSWEGHLSILSDGTRDGVKVSGMVMLSGQKVTLYNTTGAVDSVSHVLVLNDSQFHNESSGLTADLSYEPFIYAEPLVFTSEFNTSLSGYQIRYVMTNSAQRIE